MNIVCFKNSLVRFTIASNHICEEKWKELQYSYYYDADRPALQVSTKPRPRLISGNK